MSKYAIVDIETTGGNSENGKITEISIFLHDGTKIIAELTSLINPERVIPPFITNLTGISNEMVENAPTFAQLARQIIEITDGAIFVAHNSTFDYNFLKHEFTRLGYDYVRETLCTVKAARSFIPGHQSYSLGNLCNDLNIHIEGRHRARGDAEATVKIFELCLQNGLIPENFLEQHKPFKTRKLNCSFDQSLLRKLPTSSGVYYFYNTSNDLIYIGKSKNLKQRITSHFALSTNGKSNKIQTLTSSFDIELTGSELIALLKESEEIKENKPNLNKAQRKPKNSVGLYLSFYNDVATLLLKPIAKDEPPLASFNALNDAKIWLDTFCITHNLCKNYCGTSPVFEKSCFNYGIKLCKGICAGAENADNYNIRVQSAIETLGFSTPNALIFDTGRQASELSFVLIENNCYKGYGWIERDEATTNPNIMKEHLHSTKENADAKSIINSYLAKNKVVKIVNF